MRPLERMVAGFFLLGVIAVGSYVRSVFRPPPISKDETK